MRYPDWQNRLIAYLHEARRRPFEPGVHDCALFLAGAVQAQTGSDYAAPWRGRYTTERGGLRVLRKDGHADHIAAAAAFLPEKTPSFAQAGDGAVVPTESGPALGVVQGSRIYVLRPEGLALVSLLDATRAFEVR